MKSRATNSPQVPPRSCRPHSSTACRINSLSVSEIFHFLCHSTKFGKINCPTIRHGVAYPAIEILTYFSWSRYVCVRRAGFESWGLSPWVHNRFVHWKTTLMWTTGITPNVATAERSPPSTFLVRKVESRFGINGLVRSKGIELIRWFPPRRAITSAV